MKYWIAVASREHVLLGKSAGIMQVCHGKLSKLNQVKPGDWIIYYSPTEIFGKKDICRKFTSIGRVKTGDPYQYEMAENFIPWRRDIKYLNATEVAIEPLLDKLSFIKNKVQWGFMFRFGLFSIPRLDFEIIASHMGIHIHEQEEY